MQEPHGRYSKFHICLEGLDEERFLVGVAFVCTLIPAGGDGVIRHSP